MVALDFRVLRKKIVYVVFAKNVRRREAPRRHQREQLFLARRRKADGSREDVASRSDLLDLRALFALQYRR
jgi:hypothetical protein